MATVLAKLGDFSIIAALWDAAEQEGRSISFDDWKRRQMVLLLGTSHELREGVRTANQVLFTAIVQTILDMDDDESRENWVFLDEARQAGRLVSLTDFMVESASRGGKVCMAFQDDKGMDEEYGKNLAGELCGQPHTLIVTKLNQGETAENAAKRFGEFEQYERKVSTTNSAQGGSTTTTWELMRRPSVMPSELQSLPIPNRKKNVGITYFGITPIGAYEQTMNCEFVDSLQWQPDRNVSDFVAQSDDAQDLRPWDEADLRRLRLPLSILDIGAPAPKPSGPKPELVRRKNGKPRMSNPRS